MVQIERTQKASKILKAREMNGSIFFTFFVSSVVVLAIQIATMRAFDLTNIYAVVMEF